MATPIPRCVDIEEVIATKHFVTGIRYHIGLSMPLSFRRNAPLEPRADCYRIALVRKGEGSLHINGSIVPLEAPCALFLAEGDVVDARDARGLECDVVHFSPLVLNASFTGAFLKGEDAEPYSDEAYDLYCLWPFMAPDAASRALALDLSSAERAEAITARAEETLRLQHDAFWPCRGRSYFLELLLFLRNLYDCPALGLALDPVVAKVLDYVHGNYGSPLSLEGLCDRFGINRTSLNARFRRQTGMSVMRYVAELRVGIAATLLRKTTMPIKELAFRLGFSDEGNFSRAFKRYKTLAPSEYRRERATFRYVAAG
jgi:AraC family L-rhamnose operon regulatory protein RhaS